MNSAERQTMHPTCGESAHHESAIAQIAGAAPYVDDLPELRGTLHGAPILSGVAHGKLNGVDASAALALPGVHGVILAGDVPGDAMLAAFAGDEPVFAIDTVQHVGQVIGLVVADTVALARRPPGGTRHRPPARRAGRARRVGATKLRATAGHVQPGMRQRRWRARRTPCSGTLEVGGQEHFYLEGQVAYALPQEQNQWLIYSSTQHPGEVQHWVAHALGLDNHAVRVECRRLGGGFGGKETQAGHLAVWAAVAAAKLQRPVKLRLDRDDDFHDHRQTPPVQLRLPPWDLTTTVVCADCS
jgi:xanthine dehydrogenase large subunit